MTHDEIVKQNGSLVVAAKAFAEARTNEVLDSHVGIGDPNLHDVTVAAAGNLSNLLADRLADPADGMHTVHAGNYFGFLMEKPEDEA